MSNDKWYQTREGWIGFFNEHFDVVRPLVRFYSGSPAGNALDKFKNLPADSPPDKLYELWKILQQAWEDAPDDRSIHYMTGWSQLCDLCSEGMGLIDPGELDGEKEEAEAPH